MSTAINRSITPQWDEIEKAQNDCQLFLNEHSFTTEVMDKITMIISELLENAIKYGSYKRQNDAINYSMEIYPNEITVEVKHPVNQIADLHLRELDKTIQWIRGYQNPFEAYIQRLKAVASLPLHNSESKLGLVRIAYEGESILDFYVDEDDVIAISAIYNITRKR